MFAAENEKENFFFFPNMETRDEKSLIKVLNHGEKVDCILVVRNCK